MGKGQVQPAEGIASSKKEIGRGCLLVQRYTLNSSLQVAANTLFLKHQRAATGADHFGRSTSLAILQCRHGRALEAEAVDCLSTRGRLEDQLAAVRQRNGGSALNLRMP